MFLLGVGAGLPVDDDCCVQQGGLGPIAPEGERRFTVTGETERVDELRRLECGGHVSVEVGEPGEHLLLVCFGLHRLVGRFEVGEVLHRPIRGGVGGRHFEHHGLVQVVDGADRLSCLDAGEQAQRLVPVAIRTDTEAGVERLSEP